jgi:hypothetical protein
MQEKHVVTAFLRHKGRILILRRSGSVGTYQGKWAAVSGYAETMPDEQVLTEIEEEAGLEKEELSLVKKGSTIEAVDEALDTTWVVHPYLFDIKNRDRIRIDWEHKEARWIAPDELGGYDTVPKLKEALDEVLT